MSAFQLSIGGMSYWLNRSYFKNMEYKKRAGFLGELGGWGQGGVGKELPEGSKGHKAATTW